MGEGLLQVSVYAEKTGRPLQGALVMISGNGVDLSLETDEKGRTKKIALKSPDKKYSLEEQHQVRPYAKYTVKVEKRGLRSVRINGVQVFDGQTTLQNVMMKAGPEEDVEIIDIPENPLFADYPPPKAALLPRQGIIPAGRRAPRSGI